MSDNFRIAIIGGGFAGITSAIYLHDLLDQSATNFEIVVFYDSNLFGGRSFSGINDSHISNTSVSTTFLGELNYSFTEYIKKHKGQILSEGNFFPRNWVKDFLQYYVESKCPNIKFIQDTVSDLKKEAATFNVIGSQNSYDNFDIAILATGLPGKIMPGMVEPYDKLPHFDKLLDSKSIAVYGSNLSAIDTLVYLYDKKYTGNITVYSLAKHFPKVREKIVFSGQSKFKIRHDAYAKTFKSIDDKVNFLVKYCENNFLIPSDNESVVEDVLNKDIYNCENNLNSWTFDVIYLIEFITAIWDELNDDHLIIVRKTIEKISPYLNSFPLFSANKIKKLFESNQLNFVTINPLSGDNKILNNHDYSFNCTGYGTDLSQNVLIDSMYKNKLVKMLNNRLLLDSTTMEVNENLYAIGPVTIGNFPFVFGAHNTQQQVLKMIININKVNEVGNKRY